MDPDGTLADLLKRHRATAGMTQEELAERAEVSARTISDTERGMRTSIYKDTTKRIADALGLQGDVRSSFERAARGRRGSHQPAGPPLPVPPTTLIGREAELGRVVDALESEVRLITLSGPGGIGKTRIALEVAHGSVARFAGRVFFIQLGAIGDARLVASEIARAVGISWAPSDVLGAIVEHLRHADSLLVLDTFEHLLDAAPAIAAILAGAPSARVIATSREALRVRGEHEIAIAPFARREDATALFYERARAVAPDLQLDDQTAETVSAICRKLDGVPLAIELAAARAKHLPLPVLFEQLEHSLNVLTGGARDLPERQRTMRDTVRWSEGLLEDDQRSLFRELSVFAGGWTLEAATAVGSAGENLTALQSALIDKSLVVRLAEDEARYRMLDVIREFAAELRGDDGEINSRHASFFLALALQAESALGTAEQERWFRALAADQDNVRVALRWAIETGDVEIALSLGGALWQFWRAHGDVVEGRDWLRRSLALPGGNIPLRAKVLWGAAWLAYHQDDYDEATRYGEELSAFATATNDAAVRRNALTVPGIVAMAQGRYDDARALFEQAVEVLRPIGQNWLFATSLLNLGSSCVRVDHGTARGLLEQARDLYERLGDRFFAARASIQIAFCSMAEGDLAEAGSLISESLKLFAESEDPWGTAESLEAMSAVEAAFGRTEDAALLTGAARAIRSTIAVRQHPFDAAWIDLYIEDARASADPAAWQRWIDEGATLDIDRVMERALNSLSSSEKR